MKLTTQCQECGARKILHSEHKTILTPIFWINGQIVEKPEMHHFKTFKCFHTELIITSLEKLKSLQSLDGKKQAYDYQVTGVEFGRDTNYNCLIADAMGLGKTIQAALMCRNGNLFPVIVVVKSATTFQWIREWQTWVSDDPYGVFPIIGTQGFIPPGMKCYVISMDTLGRNGTWKKLLKLKPKAIILDECHSFKDRESSRTQAVINLIKEGKLEHKILLSGTPIKNRASEYKVSLNILAPDYFSVDATFDRQWLTLDRKRIRNEKLESFKNLISRWVLRREKLEVLTDLPPFRRDFQFIECTDQEIKNTYNAALKQFQFRFDTERMENVSILGELQKLRRITGMGKIEYAIEYCKEFLQETDLETAVDSDFPNKLAIGIHHESVRDTLYSALYRFHPLKLSGEDSAWRKDSLVQEFNRPDRRILIINMLAGGVGLNLQMCSSTLCLERQWNAADEEQYESRFHRNGQIHPVTADYPIMKTTVDEFFHNMVEEKRGIFGDTVGKEWSFSSDSQAIRQVVEQTLANPL